MVQLIDKLKLNTRVTLLIVSTLLVIFIVLGAVVYISRKNDTIKIINERMHSQLEDIVHILDLNLAESNNFLKVALNIAHEKLYEKGKIDVDTSKNLITVKNQISKLQKDVQINKWKLQGEDLIENYELVDEIKKITGANATIFQRFNDGYVRISTNVIDDKGKRVIYTYIPNESEVAKTISENKTYFGRAFVVNDWYLAAYEPITKNDSVIGMLFVGVKEKDLTFLKEKFYAKKYWQSGYPLIISSNGVFLVHPQLEGENHSDKKFFKDMQRLQNGYSRYKWPEDETGKMKWQFFTYYKPYDCYVAVSVYEDEILTEPLNKLIRIIIIGILLGTIIFTIVIRLIVNSLTKPLQTLNNTIKQLSKGDLNLSVEINRQDEIGEISESLNKTISGLKRTAAFASAIGKGDFTHDFQPQSKDDKLGNALIEMKMSLQAAMDEEKRRKEEDAKMNWANQGLAKFGEILRLNNDNIEILSNDIISNLVKYVNANQGALYLLNTEIESDQYLEMIACYAWEKKKYIENKRIELDEDLTGQCIMDKETILLTDVPDSYITITSGLGKTNPRNILLTPLKVNDEIHGVIELASLYLFEKYQIEFIEKIAESVATTLGSVKINQRTAKLLKESQQLAQRLSQQEEEMRQNMEELHATQEEATRQAAQLASFTDSVNHTLVRAEYDTSGKLLYANTRFLKKLGYSSASEVLGKNISIFIHKKDTEWFFKIWKQLAKGGKHFEGDMKHVTKDGKDFWSMATYTCVRNQNGDVEKILFLGIDTTAQKKQSLDYQGQLDALNHSNIKAEFLPNGKTISCNQRLINTLGFKESELLEKTIFDIVANDDNYDITQIWNKVIKGNPYEGRIKCFDKKGDEVWLQGTFCAVYDMYNDIAKIIYIASDITAQRKIEIEAEKQTIQLKAQEEQLRQSQEELQKQHEAFKQKTAQHIKEIEAVKIRNEKTLEGALDAIVTMNDKEKIELFNKAAEDLWGIKREQVLGHNIKILLPPEFANLKEGEVVNYLKSKENKFTGTRTEVNIVDKKGNTIPVLITVSEAKIGKETTYTAFIQNISVELF